ncbi:MAG TPA: universal stress protein [Gemmatimonadaceae bacterium]|nr:universal stress protein [Gemmatimonadaceae bacterium]
METLRIPSIPPELGVRASKAAPVIIATDGQAQSDAALVVGRMFAQKSDALRLVSVVRPVPIIPESGMVVSKELELSRRAEIQREVIAQMTRTWESLNDVEIHEGDPASVIARLAHQANATMIVSGLGRHRVADRIFGDETALRLIRLADVPVFAAAEGLNRAPSRIVVACDFSETSVRAARLATELASTNATLYLAHVAPRDGSRYEWDGWGKAYKQDALDALQKTREQLRPPEDMVVQTVMLQGDAATELLAFAASVQADLIATGSHGHGFVARMLIGSVATRILRMSTKSVLTVPHAAVMTDTRMMVSAPIGEHVDRAEWAAMLSDFSRRNQGRRGMLEVDDAEIGAQAQEFDYPLRGAAYDHNDHRVSLMFGDEAGTGHHLSRGISNVSSIAVLRGSGGKDLALRIAHGKGQTLLTFVS